MRIRVILTATIVIAFALVMTACGGDASNLKQIQQQRAGDYVVTVLSETGQLKQGPNNFVLEFRKASDNQLADVATYNLIRSCQCRGCLR